MVWTTAPQLGCDCKKCVTAREEMKETKLTAQGLKSITESVDLKILTGITQTMFVRQRELTVRIATLEMRCAEIEEANLKLLEKVNNLEAELTSQRAYSNREWARLLDETIRLREDLLPLHRKLTEWVRGQWFDFKNTRPIQRVLDWYDEIYG